MFRASSTIFTSCAVRANSVLSYRTFLALSRHLVYALYPPMNLDDKHGDEKDGTDLR